MPGWAGPRCHLCRRHRNGRAQASCHWTVRQPLTLVGWCPQARVERLWINTSGFGEGVSSLGRQNRRMSTAGCHHNHLCGQRGRLEGAASVGRRGRQAPRQHRAPRRVGLQQAVQPGRVDGRGAERARRRHQIGGQGESLCMGVDAPMSRAGRGRRPCISTPGNLLSRQHHERGSAQRSAQVVSGRPPQG